MPGTGINISASHRIHRNSAHKSTEIIRTDVKNNVYGENVILPLHTSIVSSL